MHMKQFYIKILVLFYNSCEKLALVHHSDVTGNTSTVRCIQQEKIFKIVKTYGTCFPVSFLPNHLIG